MRAANAHGASGRVLSHFPRGPADAVQPRAFAEHLVDRTESHATVIAQRLGQARLITDARETQIHEVTPPPDRAITRVSRRASSPPGIRGKSQNRCLPARLAKTDGGASWAQGRPPLAGNTQRQYGPRSCKACSCLGQRSARRAHHAQQVSSSRGSPRTRFIPRAGQYGCRARIGEASCQVRAALAGRWAI